MQDDTIDQPEGRKDELLPLTEKIMQKYEFFNILSYSLARIHLIAG